MHRTTNVKQHATKNGAINNYNCPPKRRGTPKIRTFKVIDGKFVSTNERSKQVAPDAEDGVQSQKQATGKDRLLDIQIPKSHFPEPDWARRLRLEWCQACEPTVTWRSEEELRGNAGEQGATVGSWLVSYLYHREYRWNELNEEQRRFAKAQFEDIKRLASEFFEAPRWQAAEFFKRFARALDVESFDSSGLPKHGHGDNLTWPIKRVMLSEWPSVVKLSNTSELCTFLLKRLPPNIAKGIERTETLSAAFLVRVQKICRRCGLRFKGRGRPRRK